MSSFLVPEQRTAAQGGSRRTVCSGIVLGNFAICFLTSMMELSNPVQALKKSFILIMHRGFLVCFISNFIVQVASTSNALVINDEFSNDESFFNEINPDIFPDNDINEPSLTTDLFFSDATPDLDDTAAFVLANKNTNSLADNCGLFPSSFRLIKARSSSDACNADSDPPIFNKEDAVAETQEEVERFWCSGNKEQGRGKVPVCSFTYENQDVEIMLDGSLCSFDLFFCFFYLENFFFFHERNLQVSS